MSDTDRHAVKSAIKHALRPDSTVSYDGSKKWSARVYNRLTTLAIYSCADKKNIPYQSCAYLKRWCMGWEYLEICKYYHKSEEAVRKGISRALDFIIDNVEHDKIINIPVDTIHPIVQCPRNDGQLLWNPFEGYYSCIQCSRHYTTDIKLIGAEYSQVKVTNVQWVK